MHATISSQAAVDEVMKLPMLKVRIDFFSIDFSTKGLFCNTEALLENRPHFGAQCARSLFQSAKNEILQERRMFEVVPGLVNKVCDVFRRD